VHRLWQVLLWLGANGLAAWLLVRRKGLNLGSGLGLVLTAAWAFLFLFQAPVWYHLAILAGFLYWGIEVADFKRTLVVVTAASLWAGVSRVNWIPFPAALAALLYLIETPQAGRPLIRYLLPIFWWGLAGAIAGLGSQAAYAVFSGNPPEQFGSAFTSDLLWYRLFPNATYPLGVLPGIVLVTLPVAAAIWWGVRSGRGLARDGQGQAGVGQGKGLPLRWIGILGILAVFFGGGLVVSAKIGGGSNLHNMDGYIALLLAAAVFLVFGGEGPRPSLPPSIAAFSILVPIVFAVSTGGPVRVEPPAALTADAAELERLVETAAAGGGEVLFIAERQLITFGSVEGVALVAEYEKVFLMEMAMSGNEAYLARFESDLASGRFALVVSDYVRFNVQDREDDFGEENNAWDRYVTYPLLCYYREIQTLETARVEILAPRDVPACPEIPLE
jgi:hypothetical protein